MPLLMTLSMPMMCANCLGQALSLPMLSPAVIEQPYAVMVEYFMTVFTDILVVHQESKKPVGRRRQNFLVAVESLEPLGSR